jgi:hypothetical protein
MQDYLGVSNCLMCTENPANGGNPETKQRLINMNSGVAWTQENANKQIVVKCRKESLFMFDILCLLAIVGSMVNIYYKNSITSVCCLFAAIIIYLRR